MGIALHRAGGSPLPLMLAPILVLYSFLVAVLIHGGMYSAVKRKRTVGVFSQLKHSFTIMFSIIISQL